MLKTYFYLDVYFLNNFIIDAVLLLIFCFVMRIRVRLYKIIFAALIGAVTNCLLIILNCYGNVLHLFNLCIAFIMLAVIVGRQIFAFELIIKYIVIFYINGFMIGGILTGITGNSCSIIIFDGIVIITAALLYIIAGEHGINRFRQYNSDLYEVTLYKGDRIYSGSGYYDSGNSVREPISGSKVIIGDVTRMDSFLTEGEKKYIRMFPVLPSEWDGATYIRGIPYNSLGNRKGILPGIRIDRIDIRRGQKQKTYNNIYVGISIDKLSFDEKYDFILHREMY